jgi:replicative DNA helicase
MSDLLSELHSLLGDDLSTLDEKEIIRRLNNMVLEAEMNTSSQAKDSKSLTTLFADHLSGMQNNIDTNHLIKSGFGNLDNLIGGFLPGEFIVIGGRPAMGKTQFCVNLCLNISKEHPVLYFTFDLSEYLLVCRFISALTEIETKRILQNELTNEEKIQIAALETKLKKHRININDSCNSSVTAFKAHCLKQIYENGVKVILVDYLQMMSTTRYRNSRELEISYISRELKSLARDHNVCVIATSQLSRSPEKRSMAAKPFLSDLRDSGAIEQDADKVIFLYRPEYYAIDVDEEGNSVAGLMELIVAKNRNGGLGTSRIKRNAVFSSFTDFLEYSNEFFFSPTRLNELEDKPF